MIKKRKGKKAILMLHGRGADAENILGISEFFEATSYAFTAERNEWYPYPFMQPRKENEPKLSESLKRVEEAIQEIRKEHEEIYILGFSQGACLALEYGAKHELQGIIAYSGGFIGTDSELQKETKTKKILICCSSNDPFIPLKRAKQTAETYKENKAHVTTNFYEGNTHTITRKDIELAKETFKL